MASKYPKTEELMQKELEAFEHLGEAVEKLDKRIVTLEKLVEHLINKLAKLEMESKSK